MFFPPFRSLQFSLLPGRTHSSGVSPQYFLFFFVNIGRPCVSRMILSTVSTCNFFQAIFLHVVWVLFTAFHTCLSSSTGFPVVSIFLTFKALQGREDILLNSLYTIANFLLLGIMGLVESQNVSVGLDSSLPFLMEILPMFVTPCFPRADAISSFVANANSLLLITPLEVLSFSCR